MFSVIADGLDDLKTTSSDTRNAVVDLGERAAGQEVQVKNLWHQLRRVEEGVSALPETIARALERHEDTCAGREYAKAKLTATTTKSDVPLSSLYDSTAALRIQRQADANFAGMSASPFGVPLPKLILYFGGGIGAALAGAAYLLIQLGVISVGN